MVSAIVTVLLVQAIGPSAGKSQPPAQAQPQRPDPLQPGARYAPAPPPAPAEMNLATRLDRSGRLDLYAGELAKERGGSPRVRALGDRILRDHVHAERLLRHWLAVRDARLPDETPDEHQRMTDELRKLSTLSGAAFDREFLSDMVREHDQAIRDIETARTQVHDRLLAETVDELLPILRQHRELAHDLQR